MGRGVGAGAATALTAVLLAGCGGPDAAGTAGRPTAAADRPTGSPTGPPPPGVTADRPTGSSTVSPPPGPGATAAPDWLGTRVLPPGPGTRPTPPELRDRRIATVDELPPPPGGRFRSTVTPVPVAVQERSTWTLACPVRIADLRYLTVTFRGFDGRAHTGELLVHRDVADAVGTVFAALFRQGFPIERMRVVSAAELTAPPTGDGNNTTGFVCRPARGSTSWSEHAYGRAIDVNPFHNPYLGGGRVLPELATAYTDRGRVRPGMVTPGVRAAFAAAGWSWGGDWSSPVDPMHFSSSGR